MARDGIEALFLPGFLRWTPPGRALVFLLSATSIGCLLAEFYGLCPMRFFALVVLAPATVILTAMAILDAGLGDGKLCRAVIIGAFAGLIAAIAYDLFRLPFVFARPWHLGTVVPPMNLFKVFPRFGAMILGESVEQDHYSLRAQTVGWAYHFSNGITFGVMYVALIGDACHRSWKWAIAMAVGLESGMLFTPYPRFFGITVTLTFIIVTFTAHAIFGAAMGLLTKRLSVEYGCQGIIARMDQSYLRPLENIEKSKTSE